MKCYIRLLLCVCFCSIGNGYGMNISYQQKILEPYRDDIVAAGGDFDFCVEMIREGSVSFDEILSTFNLTRRSVPLVLRNITIKHIDALSQSGDSFLYGDVNLCAYYALFNLMGSLTAWQYHRNNTVNFEAALATQLNDRKSFDSFLEKRRKLIQNMRTATFLPKDYFKEGTYNYPFGWVSFDEMVKVLQRDAYVFPIITCARDVGSLGHAAIDVLLPAFLYSGGSVLPFMFVGDNHWVSALLVKNGGKWTMYFFDSLGRKQLYPFVEDVIGKIDEKLRNEDLYKNYNNTDFYELLREKNDNLLIREMFKMQNMFLWQNLENENIGLKLDQKTKEENSIILSRLRSIFPHLSIFDDMKDVTLVDKVLKLPSDIPFDILGGAINDKGQTILLRLIELYNTEVTRHPVRNYFDQNIRKVLNSILDKTLQTVENLDYTLIVDLVFSDGYGENILHKLYLEKFVDDKKLSVEDKQNHFEDMEALNQAIRIVFSRCDSLYDFLCEQQHRGKIPKTSLDLRNEIVSKLGLLKK